MALADHIDENAGSDALFLTSDSHLTPVFALAGRRILCGSGSYVYYHGMDYSAEYNAMRALYETRTRTRWPRGTSGTPCLTAVCTRNLRRMRAGTRQGMTYGMKMRRAACIR